MSKKTSTLTEAVLKVSDTTVKAIKQIQSSKEPKFGMIKKR